MNKTLNQRQWEETICPRAYFGCLGAREEDYFDKICSGSYCNCLARSLLVNLNTERKPEGLDVSGKIWDDWVSDDWRPAPDCTIADGGHKNETN